MTSEVDTGRPATQQELNHKLFTNQIDNEVAGFNERGVKAPQVRIPGKTHLSGVLLIANPWEDRDLDRKLTKIRRERIQKERTLEWNQRQFFINQIFDQDLNLRFNKLLLEEKNKQQARDAAPEFTQYYYARDNVPTGNNTAVPAAGSRMVTGRLGVEGEGGPGETGGSQGYYPVTTPRPETMGYEHTYRSVDETDHQVAAVEDHNTESGTGRTSSRKTKAKKVTPSMGIFAPPLNPKPKTKLQRDRLIHRHTQSADQSPLVVAESVAERVEIKSVLSETADVPVTSGETSKEANLKLTLPVLVSGERSEKSTEEAPTEDSGSKDEKSEEKTAENELKDATYITAGETADETEQAQNGTSSETKEDEEIHKTPEAQTKSRFESNRALHHQQGVVLPDIRINNYTVPSPIQEEDEERVSSVAVEEQRIQSVNKKLCSEPREKPVRTELKLNLPPEMLRSEPATPTGRAGPTLPSTNRPGPEKYEFQAMSREDTRLSSRLFTNTSNHGDGFDDDNQSEAESATSRLSSGLLEDDVITRLTRTLPETLMIKANQSINKIIDRRKQRMLRKARDLSSRNTMEDPRWRKLTSALSDKYASSE